MHSFAHIGGKKNIISLRVHKNSLPDLSAGGMKSTKERNSVQISLCQNGLCTKRLIKRELNRKDYIAPTQFWLFLTITVCKVQRI
jgi:hypothetical protein